MVAAYIVPRSLPCLFRSHTDIGADADLDRSQPPLFIWVRLIGMTTQIC